MTEDYGTLDAGMGNIGLALNANDIANLRTAGKWGRFISITGLVGLGLAVLGMLFFGGTMLTMMSMGDAEAAGALGAVGGTFIFIIYGIAFAISAYVYWMLYQFSTNAIKAADSGSQMAMTDAFSSLKSMLKVSGIILLVILAMYALVFLIIIIGGAATFL
jgi:hypothetical protein